ncbi:MAG TPA: V-type ATP synthase subunit K [Candidatus Omnitrophica bacterium]|nr:MAG: V-type ATP synthase subunit K [Candidatus Omnitrophota bacterium]RKY33388.1 MAG: V-type ATP synthase subunit K [Candidatus Omnitrophota bacterium]RKY43300.1 MAG: V-type ATP synthase subunit K [Candidatus Omnitrophota bacterium]HEC70056.1 V-type ATP synthase subunit K [Candidatus Omnitrophota bacterium]
MEWGLVLAITGGAIGVILAGIGSSVGIGLAGSASNGVMSEDPEKFAPLLILSALPGTQGIYGFLIGIILILKLGMLAGKIPSISFSQGLSIFFSCLPVGILGLISAIHQGKVCTSGVYMVAKQPKDFVKPMVMAVFVEFYAVLGLLTSLLLLQGIKL